MEIVVTSRDVRRLRRDMPPGLEPSHRNLRLRATSVESTDTGPIRTMATTGPASHS